MEKLNVFLFNNLVGNLWVNERNDFVFEYNTAYLEKDGALPISVSIPLNEKNHDHLRVKSFFSNLLPESDLRAKIAREKKISEDNDFLLLKAIGGECAGAISIMETDRLPENDNDYEFLPEDELVKMIDTSLTRPILISHDQLRLSLAGAQNKIPLCFKDNKFYLPKGNSPSSHILKLTSPGFDGLIENELFCMKLAERTGLDVPNVSLWEKDSKKAFIIERYDRFSNNKSNLERLHQEDFCQVSGTGPNRKYENEGGPGFKECIAIINRYCSVPVIEKAKFINWVIFNFLIGNCDAHAKNISFLYSGNKNSRQNINLAPFYDLVSTLTFPALSKKMAMHIGGKKQIDYVMKTHWERFADEIDIKYSTLENMFSNMSKTITIESEELLKSFGKTSETAEISGKIYTVITKQVNRLASITG